MLMKYQADRGHSTWTVYLETWLPAATYESLPEMPGSGQVVKLTKQLLLLKAVNIAGLQSHPLGPGIVNPHAAVEVALLPLG